MNTRIITIIVVLIWATSSFATNRENNIRGDIGTRYTNILHNHDTLNMDDSKSTENQQNQGSDEVKSAKKEERKRAGKASIERLRADRIDRLDLTQRF